MAVKTSRNFYHVTINGREVIIAKGIGADRKTEAEAVKSAEVIARKRGWL